MKQMSWAQRVLRSMIQGSPQRGLILEMGDGAPSSEDRDELVNSIWDLYSDSRDDAIQLLPILVDHQDADLKTAALRGLANLYYQDPKRFQQYLDKYRMHAASPHSEIREAAALGLRHSDLYVDESVLWALVRDADEAVAETAACSLRASIRKTIDEDRFAHEITSHPNKRIRVILMQRILKEEHLRPIALREFLKHAEELRATCQVKGEFDDLWSELT